MISDVVCRYAPFEVGSDHALQELKFILSRQSDGCLSFASFKAEPFEYVQTSALISAHHR